MNLTFAILFLFIGLSLTEQHIPRDIEPNAENIHQKISKESEIPLTLEAKDIKPIKVKDLGETLNVKNVLTEKDIPSTKTDASNQQNAIGGGVDYIHNPSYITLTMLIASRSVDCYYYKATNSFEVDFQVLKGGDFDIALSIYDAKTFRVAFQKSSNDGNVKVVVPPDMINKDYSICFDNHESSRDTKKVFMMIDVAHVNNINTPEYAQLNKLDLMHTALSNIYTSLIQMEQLQEKQRSIETIDRSIMERNYEYVTMWCIIQIIVMIIVSAIQLILIRSLFDAKGGIGATIWRKLHNLTGGRF